MSSSETRQTTASQQAEPAADMALSQVQDALRGLKFGNVSITVQDGVVVQIDRTERRRLRRAERC